jgi:hypothetical protein
MELLTILAVIMWMALGAAIALVCQMLRGRKMWKSGKGPREYGLWLGMPVEVLFNGTYVRCTVVAVSWKGAMAVRSGKHAKSVWIPKAEVAERVRWEAEG